jgi:hypothetical protein
MACWEKILPRTVLPETREILECYQRLGGAPFSGCGGGYLIVASAEPVPDGFQATIRRPE